MKSILHATAILSSSSLISIAVGLVSSKALALLLGPGGYGLVGLLQSLLGLAGLFAGSTAINTGLVRDGAKALAHADYKRVVSFRRAAWLLLGASGSFLALLLVLFRVPVSQAMLGDRQHGGSVVWIGCALLFTLAASLQTSSLNAHHCIKALAKLSIINSVLGSSITIFVVWLYGTRGIAPAIVAAALANLLTSQYYFRQSINYAGVQVRIREVMESAQSLLGFGAPYGLSILMSTGVQLAMPILVLHTLGTSSVGFYRAAVNISVGYLGFLLIAMAQDYNPRIAAAAHQPNTVVHLVNQQQRLIMILSVPVILGAVTLMPYLVPLVYSSKFYPAVAVLEWQLLADLFKFSSWTMSYVIVVRKGGLTFFFTELVAGVTTLSATWLSIRWFGVPGLGIGFFITYVVYWVVVWAVVRRDIALVWTRSNKLMFIAAIGACLAIRVLPFSAIRTALGLCFAAVAGVASLHSIWREMSARGQGESAASIG